MQAIKLIFSSEFTSYLKELNVKTCSLVQVLCFWNLASTDSLNKLTCIGLLKSLSLWLYRIVRA